MLLKASEAILIAKNANQTPVHPSIEELVFQSAREGRYSVTVNYELSSNMQDTLRKLGYLISVSSGMDFVITETTISWPVPNIGLYGIKK